ncbi:hypothetical protein Tco_0850841 [Tanacetum coccineum]
MLNLHDRCYARQAVVDNAMNRRSRELLKVFEKLRGEADVMRAKELACEEECEGIRAKCESAMTDFDKTLLLMLKIQKWTGYQVSLSALESKVTSLEAEKANLEATEASLRQEIEEVKHDRREVVSKVVPYACMELLHSDELGRLVRKLVSSAITFGRCRAYEQVARMKEPFDLSMVKGYHPSFAIKESPHSTKTCSFEDPNACAFFPASTSSSAPFSKHMSPPADIGKPSLSLNE